MFETSTNNLQSGAAMVETTTFDEWRGILTPASVTLRALAGTTEDEFLQIGSQMQDFYLRSSEITAMANRLVESVSGESAQSVIEHLRHMIRDMEAYLISAHSQSHESCNMLERILELLGQVSQPLEGFQKMYKVLRMLSTSTKIESSRLGETGMGFLTLALDVEKLSHLVNEKSASILKHRQALAMMISDNLKIVRTSESSQETELSRILTNTSRGLEELVSVNSHCSDFGAMISAISGEVSDNISVVVSSMQMHDMTRQQVEHIEEALEHLSSRLIKTDGTALTDESSRKLLIEAGDVCELQSAQLRHATSELCGAVHTIVDNLRDVASKQTMMASETVSTSGVANSSGGSFVQDLSNGMATVTAALAKCAQADRDMSATMKNVGETMQEITGFVTDIEDIGSEIDLIALNAQIKAAHTGKEGAALGVLAEAIKRLSLDAVTQTELVSHTLLQINTVTDKLFSETLEETEHLNEKVTVMENELGGILSSLNNMNVELVGLLSGLNDRVGALTDDIYQATGGIDVHERVKQMGDNVVDALDRIVEKARQLEPASSEFKDNLRHMEERYTMQSERHIHESIARARGSNSPEAAQVKECVATESESEFGDNVDLF